MLPARLRESRHFCCTCTTMRGQQWGVSSPPMSLSSVLCNAEALDHREREQNTNLRDGWCRLLKEMEELCLEWRLSFPDFAWDRCTMWSPTGGPLIQAAGCYGNTCCRCWTRCVQHSWGFPETCAPHSYHPSALTPGQKKKAPGAGSLMRPTVSGLNKICFSFFSQVQICTCPANIFTGPVTTNINE